MALQLQLETLHHQMWAVFEFQPEPDGINILVTVEIFPEHLGDDCVAVAVFKS